MDNFLSNGIIIRATPYGEADLILTAICAPGGKISIFARNARKSNTRFGSRLDIFDQGRLELAVRRGELFALRSFTPTHAFRHIREDLDKFTAAAVAIESFEMLVQDHEEEGQAVLDLLSLCLRSIDESASAKESLKALLISLAHLLAINGLGQSDTKLSASGLLSTLAKVEQYSGRKMASRSSLNFLLKKIR